MAVDYKDVDPQIKFGPNREKLVQVGSLQWDGFNAIIDAIAKADLPIPTISADGVKAFIEKQQAEFQDAVDELQAADDSVAAIRASAKISALNANTTSAIFGFVAELIGSNLPTFYQWALRHKPIVDAVLVATTNMTREEVAALRAVDAIAVARKAWERIVADGFFEEIAGFFGELLGVTRRATSANDSQPAAS